MIEQDAGYNLRTQTHHKLLPLNRCCAIPSPVSHLQPYSHIEPDESAPQPQDHPAFVGVPATLPPTAAAPATPFFFKLFAS